MTAQREMNKKLKALRAFAIKNNMQFFATAFNSDCIEYEYCNLGIEKMLYISEVLRVFCQKSIDSNAEDLMQSRTVIK